MSVIAQRPARRFGTWLRLLSGRGRIVVLAVAIGVLGSACGGPSNLAAQASNQSAASSAADSGPALPPPSGAWKIPAAYRKALSDNSALNQIDTTSTCHAGATNLTFWTWVPGINRAINLYNMTHPTVCVQWVNTAGVDEETKLRAAMQSGVGVPDLFQDQQYAVNNWILTKDVANINEYGANSVESGYVNWAWKIVSPFSNSAVYGLPQDSGPMGLLYNAALFKKYGLKVPVTWSQFAQEAVSLHKAHPGVYLINFNGFPLEQLLWWQTGAYPVKWSGGVNLVMNYDLPGARTAAEFWQKLWSEGALANIGGNGSYKAAADGTVLMQFSAAWYPDVFTTPGSTNGQWRAALLPQWQAGAQDYPNDGGSVDFVAAASAHPKLATDFDIWLNTSQASWYVMVRPPLLLFPTVHSVLGNSTYLSQTIPLTGPQPLWQVYSDIESHVNNNWEWSPIEPEAETVMGDEMDDVLSNTATLPSILAAIQSQLMSVASFDGFKVSS
jgi:multiple sugar transport system substrate-binding protein